MGIEEVSKKGHSLDYIYKMIEWGFDMEFIAKDAGITLESLEMRLYRAKKREQKKNEHKGNEPQTGGNNANSRRGKKGER